MQKLYQFIVVLCLTVSSVFAQNISRIEYYFNTDPGFGLATAITGYAATANVANLSSSIDLSAIANGLNTLYFRSKDANGKWSITNSLVFVKQSVATANIAKAEYFINTDPGFGLGTTIAGYGATANVVGLLSNIDLSAVANGLNTLYFRSKDANGKWSITNSFVFVKQSVATANIAKAEYFINTDPGFGLGTNLVVANASNINKQAFTVDVSSFAMGINTLYFRTKDNLGIWSLTNSATFIKVEAISNLTAMEYYIDTDPGFDKATAVTITPALDLNNMTFSADLTAVTIGNNHNLFVRAKDTNGKWSLTNILSFKRTTLGLNQFTEVEKQFTVYPNPAKEQFLIKYPLEKTIKSIDMIDITGKTIPVKVQTVNDQVQVETNTMESGTFFVRITTGDGVIYKKIIVTK